MIWRKIGGNWQILFPPALASTSVGDDSSAGFGIVVPVGYTLFAKIIRGNCRISSNPTDGQRQSPPP